MWSRSAVFCRHCCVRAYAQSQLLHPDCCVDVYCPDLLFSAVQVGSCQLHFKLIVRASVQKCHLYIGSHFTFVNTAQSMACVTAGGYVSSYFKVASYEGLMTSHWQQPMSCNEGSLRCTIWRPLTLADGWLVKRNCWQTHKHLKLMPFLTRVATSSSTLPCLASRSVLLSFCHT